MNFVCPNCKNSTLHKIQCQVTVVSEVNSVDENGEVNSDDIESYVGEDEYFECGECSVKLLNKGGSFVSNGKELYQWLKENG